MAKKIRAAVYLRVSTTEQTTENQMIELQRVADAAGYEIVDVYEDAGISGAKGRDERPAFDQMCKDAVNRKFDIIMAWSVDRLGRSLQDLLAFLEEVRAVKCDLYLHQQGIDTSTPAGKAMFQMMGVFAEFERSMIQERVRAGRQRAKSQGVKFGRKALDKKDPEKAKKIVELRTADPENPMGKKAIAKQLGCGVGTVTRILQEQGVA